MKNIVKMLIPGALGITVFGLLLFVSAGTFDYSRAWIYLAVLVISGWIVSIYFLRADPAVIERRMPATEARTPQRVIVIGVYLMSAAMLVVSALDYRFGWSSVPMAVSLAGDILVVVGIGLIGVVLAQNSHAAVTVRVESGQQVASTGLYGLVRHPMYTCNAFLLIGSPLALGSYWGLAFVIPVLLVFTVRIRDEEKMLRDELDGYREYMQKVRYRLVPGVW